MNTPPRKQRVTTPSTSLSAEDKERLIENLDIEVANHRRRFEGFLEQLLEGFTLRHGMEITRIPKSIRQIKLKDFDKYGGNIQASVQAIAKERIAESDGEGHAKKRKWQAALLEASHEEERATKTPRLAPASPSKPTPKANKSRALFPKTPTRTGLNLPIKPSILPNSKRAISPVKEIAPSKSRPASPVKHTSQFKPASTVFNPILPPKTPTYPRRHPKNNEAIMSVNGTPLAMPRLDRQDTDQSTLSKETKSNGFIVRRDPSSNPSYSMASTSTAVSNTSTGAMITLSTHRGQTIQFDPLTTSPGTLEKLPGLTDSAKKQVRDDTARIVQALAKWTI